jgi:RNA polymerase sigma factor (sigma-70 family)
VQDRRSDAELLQAAGDDPEAFGVFYDRHVRMMLAYFYRRTASAELAADLAAETFADAFESRRRYRDTGAPATAWLLAIAKRELARVARRGRVADRARRRLGMPRLAVDDASLERIEELADFQAARTAIRAALDDLSPKLAEAVKLRVGLELSYAEVAERLGCTEATARARTARGLGRLTEAMEAYQ